MKVFMVSQPAIYWAGVWQFLTSEGHDASLAGAYHSLIGSGSHGDVLPEIGGRLCYMSFGKGRKTNAEYLKNIIEQKHFSVLEHANWSFIITGVTRSLTHELVRHRHFSFSQLSQRYVDESEAEFIVPVAVAEGDNKGITAAFIVAAGAARAAYKDLVPKLEAQFAHIENATERRKAARQIARAVLPNMTETKIMVTGNARTWREFIEKRNSKFADPEIRTLAQMILAELHKSAPNIFADLVEGK